MKTPMGFKKFDFNVKSLGFRSDGLDDLEAFFNFLWIENSALNLFSRQTTEEDLVQNHFIDCLLPLSFFPKELDTIADFGSGGGLPGVLYAIHFKEKNFHLFEKSPKKREFLNKCKKFAPNLQIHGEIPKDLPGCQLITARAFKPIDVILDLSRNHFLNGGRYFLLKGRLEKIQEELVLAKKKFSQLQEKITPLKSPVLEVERHLVELSIKK